MYDVVILTIREIGNNLLPNVFIYFSIFIRYTDMAAYTLAVILYRYLLEGQRRKCNLAGNTLLLYLKLSKGKYSKTICHNKMLLFQKQYLKLKFMNSVNKLMLYL